MQTKPFVLLLVGVLVLGGSLIGAFAGGVAVGKGRVEESAQTVLQSAQATPTPEILSEGEISEEQLEQIRQRFQDARLGDGGAGFGGGGAGFEGRGGLSGTIEGIEGDTVTVITSQGPQRATVGEDTVIQVSAQGTLGDLSAGATVTVIGPTGENGTVEAQTIIIVPEGGAGLFGGGFSAGDRFRPGGQ